jgi:hypothetical protein
MTRMMLRSPALHTSHEQKQTTWRTAVADALLPRLPEDLPDLDRRLQAAALSGAALACPASAQATWSDSDGQHHLVDVAISAVHQLPSTKP